jgi:UDP-glucose 4-epimerase
MKVLVTGGAGYIGSTTCSALYDAGHTPIILDSLVNGRKEYANRFTFYQGDMADEALLKRIFNEHPDIGCCIHFGALIIVPESVEKPFLYYHENVCKSLELFRILDKLGCHRIIFSSSASIYDVVEGFKVTESSPAKPSSPYARTKYMMEMVLEDMSKAMSFKGIALRYFNPIGADPKMRTGPYDPSPSHVLGKMVNVALGKDPVFAITGVDWSTRDGSGIRDYIHIWDLARAHVLAVERFDNVFQSLGGDFAVINLGTGNGVTVKELVTAFEKVYGKTLNKQIAPSRPGDVAGAYANCERAKNLLGWQAEYSIEQSIEDALRWTDIERKKILGY